MTDYYPAATVEYVPLNITRSGTQVTTGVSSSVVPDGQPAGSYTACTLVDGYPCFLLSGFTPGVYRVRAQVVYGGETVILDCGTLTVVP